MVANYTLGLGLLLGLCDGLVDEDGDNEPDGDCEAEGDGLRLLEALGDNDALGERLGLTDADNDADGDCDGLTEGLTDALGDGLRLGLGLADAISAPLGASRTANAATTTESVCHASSRSSLASVTRRRNDSQRRDANDGTSPSKVRISSLPL